MTRNYVELTLPEWATPLAEDLLGSTVEITAHANDGRVLRSFRFSGSSFERLGVEAELMERRVPFDVHRQEAEEGGPCRSAERRVRFDTDGVLEVDLEDIPNEMGSVYIGLLETVHTTGEREAVDAFLRAAKERQVVEPLAEVAPLPDQISTLRNAEDAARKAGLHQRRIL
ncbi:MAG: hypothetical protein P8011_14790 [Acidihalobacter sp.]|jgi:hypothetical protein|uniref:hypothetical protein n=1 Tax=Acidihalobacter sp. TaxID=1872108 RepID=UPI00307F3774